MSTEKPKFDREAFKKAIAMIESRGGKDLDNPNSSAAGRYHFLYRYIKDTPLLKGVSKREFINRPELQEKIMDMAIDGKLPGFKGYESYSNKLKAKYNTNLRSDEIAALTHFLGAGGVEKYLKDPSAFKVPGANSSVYDYVGKFNKAQGTVPSYETDMKKTIKNVSPTPPPISSSLEGFSSTFPSVQEESTPEIYSMLNEDFDEKAYSSQIDNQAIPEIPAVAEQEFNITGENQGADYVNYLVNQNAMGGSMQGQGGNELIQFNGGGTHEQNPLGGIPQGMGANGKMNTVEEGETKYTFDDGDYVFSNRIMMDGTGVESTNNNTFAQGGSMSGGCGGPGQPPCKEIVVDSKDNPRYKAYKDSLNSYNNNFKLNEKFKTVIKDNVSGVTVPQLKEIEEFKESLNYPKNIKPTSNKYLYEAIYKPVSNKVITDEDYEKAKQEGTLKQVTKKADRGQYFESKDWEYYKLTSLPQYEKPKEKVKVSDRAKEKPVTDLRPLTDFLKDDFIPTASDVKLKPNPKIDYWEVTEEVNQNSGSSKKTRRIYSKKELDELKKKQKADESSKTGNKNRLIVKTKYK